MLNFIALDDGIWHGNLDFADVLFIISAVLFVVAAVLSFPHHASPTVTGDTHHHVDPNRHAFMWPVAFLALALLSLGFAVL